MSGAGRGHRIAYIFSTRSSPSPIWFCIVNYAIAFAAFRALCAHAINNNVVWSVRFGARDTNYLSMVRSAVSFGSRVSRSILVWILTYLGCEMLSSAEIHKMIKECWQKQNKKRRERERERIKIKCYWRRCIVLRSILKLSTIEEEQEEKKNENNKHSAVDGWHGWSDIIIIYFIIAIDTLLSDNWMTRGRGRPGGGRKLSLVCRKCIRVTIWNFHSKIICFAVLLSATFYCKMPVIDCWLGLLHQTELFLDYFTRKPWTLCDAFGALMSFENSCETGRRKRHWLKIESLMRIEREHLEKLWVAICCHIAHEQDNEVDNLNSQWPKCFLSISISDSIGRKIGETWRGEWLAKTGHAAPRQR